MNKQLSLVFLYTKASCKRLMFCTAFVPIGILAIFLIKAGSLDNEDSFMLMERALGGMEAIVLFIGILLLGIMTVVNSLNGKKTLKMSNATTGFTMRRLGISPLSSYFIIVLYLIAVITILWGVMLASLWLIGNLNLSMAGVGDIDMKLALGILRTEIGHALIPVAHPVVIAFNIVCVFVLAAEGARACYLRWHNGMPSVGVMLVLIPMFVVWTYEPDSSYILLAMLVVALYGILSVADIVSREKRPKGDPFKVNKYEGIVDIDSIEEEEREYLEVNSLAEVDDEELSLLQKYGRADESNEKREFGKIDIGLLRRRYMPLGIDLARANFLFGGCVFLGVAEHLVFHGKYLMTLNEIESSIKGVTMESASKMPYFWELQQHSYYGYILAIFLVLFLQAFWNYEYYNKKTKSVYVMKRLPDRWEYARTIWITPLIQAICVIVVMVFQAIIDFCMYTFVTPDIALPADYLMQIFPF